MELLNLLAVGVGGHNTGKIITINYDRDGDLKQIKMNKMIYIFIILLAITACEFNDKVDRVSTSGLDTLNWDSVDVVEIAEQDYYDSVQHKWVGPHADRLNGIDLSPVE